jgi:hypothetical protein
VGLRERLSAWEPAVSEVSLYPPDGGTPEVVPLRALPAARWDDLFDEHPPTQEQAQRGELFNRATFRPALIAESVVTPDGEDPLSAADWADLALHEKITGPQFNQLFHAAWALNDRSPGVDLGKG